MKKSTRYILIIAVFIAVLSLAMLVGCNLSVRVTVTVEGNEYNTYYVQKDTLLSELEKPVIEGKVFVRWEINGEEVNEDEFVIEKPCTIEAVLDVQYLTVTFIDRGESDTETVAYGKTVAERTPEEREWCTFEGWYAGSVKYDFSQPVKSDLVLNAVWTEDVEGAKAAFIAELNELYVPAAYWGENAKLAAEAYDKAYGAITAATNVEAVKDAYAECFNEISGIRSYFDVIREAIEKYSAENYFEAQMNEILAIFADAENYIRVYKGGVPTVEDYIGMAIEKADAVNTMEKDIEVAEAQKEIRIRQLENYAAEVIRNLADEGNAELVKACLAEAIEAINAAEGTTQLAEVFAQYMAALAEFLA